MAQMTIAQRRIREKNKLFGYRYKLSGTSVITEQDKRNADRIMNSYYRLCGLCDTNLILSNRESTCNTRYCKESEEKESRWYKRLKAEFEKEYGLTLVYYGWFPSIMETDGNGKILRHAISAIFYK